MKIHANNTNQTYKFLEQGVICANLDVPGKLTHLVDEAVNNIVDHSKAEKGYIFAQYFKANGFID